MTEPTETELQVAVENIEISGIGLPLSCKLITVTEMCSIGRVLEELGVATEELYDKVSGTRDWVFPEDTLLVADYDVCPVRALEYQGVPLNIHPSRRPMSWLQADNLRLEKLDCTIFIAQYDDAERSEDGEHPVEDLTFVTLYPVPEKAAEQSEP